MTYDAIVVGGGIVGLATTHRLLERHPAWRVLLLEKENGLARHQTGNNSGVIHAGVYYAPGSLKARLCVEGGKALVAYCRDNEIPHNICGKLILATSREELPGLMNLAARAKANGLSGAELLEQDQIETYEPNARGVRALRIPSTGIVDYVAVAESLGRKISERGGEVRVNEPVTELSERGDVRVRTRAGEYAGKLLITCAGLQSDRVALMNNDDLPVRIIPFRGEYYRVRASKRDIVRALLYPVPDPRFPFVDVHFTRLIDGGLEAGPNAVLAFKREGYTRSDVSLADVWETLSWPGFRTLAGRYWRYGLKEMYRSWSKPAFTRALQRMVPDIQERDLEDGGAGVRAQACHRDGSLVDDFYFVRKGNVLHVCNAPSPAATASLAIGSYIVDQLER